MGVAKFDDGVPSNPKLIAAGASACWLWFCGVLFCRRGLTDGFIPKIVVPTLVIGLPNPYKHAARLVEVGLWHEELGGYRVNGFLDWNPSKTAIEEYRRKDRERKHGNAGIQTDTPNGFRTDSERIPNDAANARGTHAGAKSESESEESGIGSGTSEKSARETAPATNHGGTYRPVNPHNKPTNLVHGGEQRRHGTHAWCDHERGKCVPFGLHDEFCKALGVPRDEAEARLKAWYPTVIAGYAGVPIGDDVFALWRNEFAGWVGTVSRKPVATESTREGRTLAAAARTAAALERGEL